MMRHLLNNRYILILIGLFIVLYFIYIRVLIERIPRHFIHTNNTDIILSLSMSILFIILLIIKTYIYYKSTYIENDVKKYVTIGKIKGYLFNIISNISTIISESLYAIDYLMKNIIPFSGNIVEYLGYILLKIEQYPKNLLNVKFTILYLVPIIFILEIIIFNKLDNYYKILLLLIIPLIINYIIFSIRIWCKDQIKGLNTCIEIELIDYIDQIVTPGAFAVFYSATLDDPINYNIHYLPKYEETRRLNNLPIEEGLVEINRFLILTCDVLGYLLYYDNKMSKYNKSIYSIINIVLYTVGWIYLFLYLYFQ